MEIYIGADHRGFQLKEVLKNYLTQKGYKVVDFGNDQYDENDDYPDFAKLVAEKVSANPDEHRGILICGSGVGVDIVANKHKGVRSALVDNLEQTYLSRNDDDTNILCLAADFVDEKKAEKIVETWLKTPFSNNENHLRRIKKIGNLEK